MEHIERTVVRGSLVDESCRMTPAYMLRLAQDISAAHTDVLGIGRETLMEKGGIFLLAKIRITVTKTPHIGDRIVVKTRPYEPMRFVYPRFTDICDDDGNVMARIDSRWVLVDTESFHIMRDVPPYLDGMFPPAGDIGDFRVERRSDYAPAYELPVRYSMIDRNSHINNCVYATIATDAFGDRLREGRDIKEMIITYHKETPFGERLSIETAEDGDMLFVRGICGGLPRFESSMRLGV